MHFGTHLMSPLSAKCLKPCMNNSKYENQSLRLSDLLAPVVTMQHPPCICCSSETKRSYANLPQLPKPYPFSTRNINTELRPTAEKETEKLFCPLKKDYGQLPKRERKKKIPQRITKQPQGIQQGGGEIHKQPRGDKAAL